MLAELAGYEGPEGLAYDPDRAAELLDAAEFPGGEGMPEITLHVPSEETADEKSRWRAFFQGIVDETGFPITVDDTLTSEQILNSGNRTTVAGSLMRSGGGMSLKLPTCSPKHFIECGGDARRIQLEPGDRSGERF